MAKTAQFKLGITLYSLTNEFHSRKYSVEELMREVAGRDLGPGLEVVGFQSFRGFPEIAPDFAERFKVVVAESGLTPSCLAINADTLIDRRSPMTLQESVDYHERQVKAAALLGFPVARFQYAAGPDVIERVAPLAEKLGVKLGLEIHAPHSIDHPDVVAYREMYARAGSPYLGFIPDFGSSARDVPPAYVEYFRWRGIDPSMIEKGLEIWHEDIEPFARRTKFLDWAAANGKDDVWAVEIAIIFGLFSRQNPRKWLEIMDQVVHVHAKFYGLNASGEDPAIDYAAILPVFVESGYDGFMSTEWEGHQVSDADGFEKVAQHHGMVRRMLAD